MNTNYKALLVIEKEGKFSKEVTTVNADQLTENDLLIKVHYSSVNYKDALSASGNRGVTKNFPHVPGIDAAGEVVASRVSDFSVGDPVIVTGFDLGMNTWGGFGEYVSVPATWCIPLPSGLSLKESMAFGTAGLTAGLSVQSLLNAGISPEMGEVVVSGATGGVGSLAIAILAKIGFDVVAISGKKEESFLLETLGAKRLMNRDAFTENYDKKPLAKTDYAAGVDTVGGPILSGMLKSVRYQGVVTCCGMVASDRVDTSIFPFILRGVQLVGIDSVQASLDLRSEVWQKLATDWRPTHLEGLFEEISTEKLPPTLDALLRGQAKGRYVLSHNSE